MAVRIIQDVKGKTVHSEGGQNVLEGYPLADGIVSRYAVGPTEARADDAFGLIEDANVLRNMNIILL